MKNFLQFRSRRWSFDAWALRFKGSRLPLKHTVCTTREEARELRDERRNLVDQVEVVKVRIVLEVVK